MADWYEAALQERTYCPECDDPMQEGLTVCKECEEYNEGDSILFFALTDMLEIENDQEEMGA